jgi:hypothetical protein
VLPLTPMPPDDVSLGIFQQRLREEVHEPVERREGMPLCGDSYRVDHNR